MLTQLRYSNLYAGPLVRLAALDPDRDAEALARWSRDTEYRRWLDSDAVRGETAAEAERGHGKTRRAAQCLSVRHPPRRRRHLHRLCRPVDPHRMAIFVGIGIGDRATGAKATAAPPCSWRCALPFMN